MYQLINNSPLEPFYHDFRSNEKYHDELLEAIFSDPDTHNEFRYLSKELLLKYVKSIKGEPEQTKTSVRLPEELLVRADELVRKCAKRMSPDAGSQLRMLNAQIQSLAEKSLRDIEEYLLSSVKPVSDYEETEG